MAAQLASNADDHTGSEVDGDEDTSLNDEYEAQDDFDLPGIKSCARNDETKSIPGSNPFIFSSGDVCIIVTYKGERIEGKVSSHALCFASPIWKKFLFPPWSVTGIPEHDDSEVRQKASSSEQEPDSGNLAAIVEQFPPLAKRQRLDAHRAKQIDFSEDDSSALLILLKIAHLQFLKIPRHLSYATLLQVAILCDQYDCISLVAPWLSTKLWLKDEETEAHCRGYEQWLFIAWVFGREHVFKSLAQCLVKTTEPSEAWLSYSPLPPGIAESIMKHREWFIDALLSKPYAAVQEYESSNEDMEPRKWVCKESKHRLNCDSTVYGSYILELRRRKLYPIKDAACLDQCVDDLRDNLRSLRIARYTCPSSSHIHDSCSPRDIRDHTNEVYEVYLQVDPCEESHYLHMKIQRQKTVDAAPAQEQESDNEEDELSLPVAED